MNLIRIFNWKITVRLALAATILLSAGEAFAQNTKAIGKTWPADQRVAISQIKHDDFDTLLKKYVDKDGMVKYKDWHASTEDRTKLQTYINSLSRANLKQPSENKDKLAYWINAYNAVTIEGILQVYPTSSIKNHTSNGFGYNIWKKLFLTVDDTRINLDSIEHKVLRKMNEPRIHFAIVCASISCPRLLNEAYVGDKLEKQLVTNTKDFFSRSRNFQANSSGQIQMSKIIEWFGKDFGQSQNDQLRVLYPYFPESARQALAGKSVSVQYLNYDWNLNEQR